MIEAQRERFGHVFGTYGQDVVDIGDSSGQTDNAHVGPTTETVPDEGLAQQPARLGSQQATILERMPRRARMP